MKGNQKRLFYLDVIRVACAILIVVYHFPLSLSGEVDILHATVNGSWGMTPVYCFFMVSGAAMMYKYGREEKLNVAAFYQKRFLHLYPLFWIAYVIGFFAVFWQLRHLYDIPSWSIIWSVLGIDGWIVNWIPTFYMVGEWFLGSILMLYLAFPAVRFFWKKNRQITMGVSFLAAACLFWYHPFPMDIKQNPVIDLFYFLLGAWIEDIRRTLSQSAAVRAERTSEEPKEGEKTDSVQGDLPVQREGNSKIVPLNAAERKKEQTAQSKGPEIGWPMPMPKPREKTLEGQNGKTIKKNKGKIRKKASGKRALMLFWADSLLILVIWFFCPVTKNLPPMEASVSAQAFGRGMFLRQGFILATTAAAYVFLMGISGWLEKSAHSKKIIMELSQKTYGIFLTHHMVSQILCRHFDGEVLADREILLILLLTFLSTWIATLAIYQIESYIKQKF